MWVNSEGQTTSHVFWVTIIRPDFVTLKEWQLKLNQHDNTNIYVGLSVLGDYHGCKVRCSADLHVLGSQMKNLG